MASGSRRRFNWRGFASFDYKPTGPFHNYHVNPAAYHWPVPANTGNNIIDGFSPNMNKFLHAGHLKNLAVASALSHIACNGKAVAMLGASLGFKDGALDQYKNWCKLASYNPDIYFDTQLPKPPQVLEDGTGEYAGCKMYNGVVIYKSDGKSTYAAHDLSFASVASPTHYLTGAEQKGHFASLGLGDKHLALGLVLGKDGQKMKSTVKQEGETANMLSAQELMDTVVACLNPTPEPIKLAWNILAWQFNSSQVQQATKFNADQWAKPEAPGMYISYTYAKLMTALNKANTPGDASAVTQSDSELLGLASYSTHYLNKAIADMQPCHVAQFCHKLAKALSFAYNTQKIVGGAPGFIYALHASTATLGALMTKLSMHPLTTV